jgi:syringomycin synthetase protein SyrB1
MNSMILVDSLHKRFCDKTRENPDQIAVIAGEQRITYSDLDNKSNELAILLLKKGVMPESIVALCVDRSIEMVIGLLAILKAGAAYLPIDPVYPSHRVHFLLEDSHAALVLTTRSIADYLDICDAAIVCIDEELPSAPSHLVTELPDVATNSLAYVIYTSGSTGKPKGVLVEHQNVLHLFDQTQKLFHFGQSDVWTLFHSISFDFAVWEIWGALLYGGKLIIVPREVTGLPANFTRLLECEGVTVLSQTPSAFRQLVPLMTTDENRSTHRLRLIILGGEAFDPQLAQPWFDAFDESYPVIVNMYGITETTIHVTSKIITSSDLALDESPIGTPLDGYKVQILDSHGNYVRTGEPGELCISGKGVTRGYLGRPALTAQKFRPGPEGSRVYLSGDKARMSDDGTLVYLGRIDEQIKIRGYRIEPSEIEACLRAVPGVESTVVLAKDYGEGDWRLVAFFQPASTMTGSQAHITTLKNTLQSRATMTLPKYMVPYAYIAIPSLPLTTNGKIDKDALISSLSLGEDTRVNGNVATILNETEQSVRDIWEKVLNYKGIEINDDFFDLGGTSLALLRMLTMVSQHFDTPLDPGLLAEGATIRAIAGALVREDSRELIQANTREG